ncbi:MAG: hypothetical protein WAL90_18285 [Desulfobacterales bacterium]
MRKLTALILWGVLLLPVAVLAAAPHELAGFVLGDRFSKYQDLADLQSRMPLRHGSSIDAIQVRPLPGYKHGMVWVGNCIVPNRIVSIRMKFADSSRNFYDELLKRYKNRFGAPSEWRGDPFHIVISWKWSFVDEQQNKISMILEHNQKDEDETVGNTIKLTMWNLVDEERACQNKKNPEPALQSGQTPEAPPDWEVLVPR